jgi:hypothetical protein
MTDNSLPDEPDNSQSDAGTKIYVPMSALKNAQVGDSIDFQVSGTVQSLEGDVGCVSPDMINGEPAPPAPAEEQGEPQDDASVRAQMHKDAMQEDMGGGY